MKIGATLPAAELASRVFSRQDDECSRKGQEERWWITIALDFFENMSSFAAVGLVILCPDHTPVMAPWPTNRQQQPQRLHPNHQMFRAVALD